MAPSKVRLANAAEAPRASGSGDTPWWVKVFIHTLLPFESINVHVLKDTWDLGLNHRLARHFFSRWHLNIFCMELRLMRKFGSMSWKRTWVWSDDQCISSLDLGSLTAKGGIMSNYHKICWWRIKKQFQVKKPLEIQQVFLFATVGRSICWPMDLSVFTQQYVKN